MTVEATVQEMFDKYPQLFSTREECFDHLFCTIGNGYEWKWGQLVYHEKCDPDWDEEAEKERNEDDYAKSHMKACQSKENIEAKKKREELWVKHGMLDKVDGHCWYPLSKKYSRLFTIPIDAKEDWKAAVEECKKMLEKDGIDWRKAKDV